MPLRALVHAVTRQRVWERAHMPLLLCYKHEVGRGRMGGAAHRVADTSAIGGPGSGRRAGAVAIAVHRAVELVKCEGVVAGCVAGPQHAHIPHACSRHRLAIFIDCYTTEFRVYAQSVRMAAHAKVPGIHTSTQPAHRWQIEPPICRHRPSVGTRNFASSSPKI